MKKRILTVILTGIMILSMTACGNKATESTTDVIETVETTEESSTAETVNDKPTEATQAATEKPKETEAPKTSEKPVASTTPKETVKPSASEKPAATVTPTVNPTAAPKTSDTKQNTVASNTSTNENNNSSSTEATTKPSATETPVPTTKPTVAPTMTPTPAPTATAAPTCAHTNKRYETVVEANCQQDGYDNIYCSDCGEFLGTNYNPQGGHGSTTKHNTEEPTCDAGGWWEETCDLCGAVINSGSIESLGCVDNGDGWCSRCGAELRDHSQPDVPSLEDILNDTPTPAPESSETATENT